MELCSIPSPSKKESRIAYYIRKRAEILKLPVIEDNAGEILSGDTNNIIIRVKGDNSNTPIFIVSHMDTVPVPDREKLRIIVENGKIRTDGTHPLGADDKAGVAMALELLTELSEKSVNARSIDFIFTVQEELGTLGASVLNPSLISAGTGFVLDSEFGAGTAINQSSDKKKFKISIYGKSSHAAVAPGKGINAVKVLGCIISKLPAGRWGSESVINPGIVFGGESTNVVPDYAELIGEVRSFSKEELNKLIEGIENTSHSEAENFDAEVKIVWEDLYSGYRVNEDSLCSDIFKNACRANEIDPVFIKSLGGSDANHLNVKGLECIVLGLGMKNIHSSSEYILKEDLIKAYRILYGIAV